MNGILDFVDLIRDVIGPNYKQSPLLRRRRWGYLRVWWKDNEQQKVDCQNFGV